MGRLLFLLLALFILVPGVVLGSEGDVRAGFERILDLWRDGAYHELYASTTGGRMTRETFSKRMAQSPLRPTCCWDKLQDVSVTMHSSTSATLTGTVTLESPEGTVTKTKRFPMRFDGGVWKIPMGELVSLAAETAKKGKRKGHGRGAR